MNQPTGYLIEYDEEGGHEYMCAECKRIWTQGETGLTITPLDENDRREEAIWCGVCDELLLASTSNQEDEDD